MVTMAPLPNISALLAAAALPCDENKASAPWRRDGDQALWFSRSAFALAALVLDLQAGRGRNSGAPVVWLPDYFCNQSTEPARRAGARIVHYPIGEDLEPNWPSCLNLINDAKPDLFVLVHYFGRPANGQAAREFCNETGATLIEDAAHALCPEGSVGSHGDATFYSPHKWLAIPNGAALIVRDPTLAIGIAGAAQALGNAAPSPMSWLIRRLIQRAMPASLHAKAIRKRTPPFKNDPMFTTLRQTPSASRLGMALLARAATDIEREATARRRNAMQWETDFGENGKAFLPVGDWTPYRFVLDAGTVETAETTYHHLAAKGCPVETWPDLAPEVIANPQRHAIAIGLRQRLVFLPVHNGVEFMDIRSWTS